MNNLIWDQLDKAFTVYNIMTPRDQWNTINMTGNDEISELQNVNLEFDVTPVVRNNEINTFIEKDYPNQEQGISTEWLISSDTTIPNLLNIFIVTNKKALFVLQNQDIKGLVSPADLNKMESRVYVYLLIGQLEIALSEFITKKGKFSREEILSSLSADRQVEIINKEQELLDSNFDPNIIELVYLSDLFTIIQKNEQLFNLLNFQSRKQTKKAMSGINDLRNDTMHLNNPLISKKDDGMTVLASRINKILYLLDLI